MARSKTNTVNASATIDQLIDKPTDDNVIHLAASEKPKRVRKPRAKKSLKDTIAAAIKAEAKTLELKATDFREVTLISTGEVGQLLPWSAAPESRPWGEGYSRVIFPLKSPTKRGARVKTLIVANRNLKHGRAA